MITLEEGLREHMERRAAGLSAPPSTLDGIAGRAHWRFVRRRVVISVTAVGVLIAGTLVVVRTGSSPSRDRVSAAGTTAVTTNASSAATDSASSSPSGTPRARPTTAVVVASSMRWQTTATKAGLLGNNVRRGGSSLYAISTAPADSPAATASRRTVYSSSDGVTWTPLDMGGAWVGDVDATGGHVYAVGTAPGTAPTASPGGAQAVVLERSSSSWVRHALPVDLRALTAKLHRFDSRATVLIGDASIAAGPNGVLVGVRLAAKVPYESLLPTGVTVPPDGSIDVGADGLVVRGANSADAPADVTTVREVTTTAVGSGPGPSIRSGVGPVVATYTWAQLGIAADLVMVLTSEPQFFFAADGRSFAPVSVSNEALWGGSFELVADETGYEVRSVSQTEPGSFVATIFASGDARSWQVKSRAVIHAETPVASGVLAGDLIFVTRNDTALALTFADATRPSLDLTSVTGDALGKGVPPLVFSGAVGPVGVAVVVGGTRSNDATAGSSGTGPPPQPSLPLYLLESADGVHWSVHDLTRLAGSPLSSASVIATDNSFVVTCLKAGSPVDKPAQTIVLVGTR